MAEFANYPCSLSPNFRHIIAVCCSKFPGNASAAKVEAAVCAEQETPVLRAPARSEARAKEPKRNRFRSRPGRSGSKPGSSRCLRGWPGWSARDGMWQRAGEGKGLGGGQRAGNGKGLPWGGQRAAGSDSQGSTNQTLGSQRCLGSSRALQQCEGTDVLSQPRRSLPSHLHILLLISP